MKFSVDWWNTYWAERKKRIERVLSDLHDYQLLAIEFLYNNPYCALFIDTGLGKTVILLTLVVRLLFEEKVNKILIIAPIKVAQQTWPNEIAAWEHTATLNYTIIRAEDDETSVIAAGKAAYDECRYWGGTTADARKAQGFAKTGEKNVLRRRRMMSNAPIHIINHEALEWLVDQYSVWVPKKVNGKTRRVRKIVEWPYDLVAIDESSVFKDYDTGKFKALSAVRQQGFISRLIEMTATPAAEGYLGLFAQMFLLDLGLRLTRFITHYRTEYFVQNPYSKFSWSLQKDGKERISDKIADICLVMKSGDYLEEEEPVFLPRNLDMTTSEMVQYNTMKRDSILEIDGDILEAETAGALSGKLLQLASGAIYYDRPQKREITYRERWKNWLVKLNGVDREMFATEDEAVAWADKNGRPIRETKLIHDHKIEDLRQLVDELGEEPILVSYWYKSSLRRLQKAFPKAVVMDKGGKMVDRHGPWNTGKIKMMLVHPASVGHGLNMQYGPGHDLYMFDMCWSYELFYQLYRRLHRQGQKLRVRIHMPLMRHTLDGMVWERLKLKEDAQEYLFGRIRAWRKAALERRARREAEEELRIAA